LAVPAPEIITCAQWGAMAPTRRPTLTPRPARIIEHHTAGLAPAAVGEPVEPRAQGSADARALQHLHMVVNGWDDSGHNFLVMRTGVILQGRWGSVTAIEHGRMVVSAHCPGQNDQPGIEHENIDQQTLTAEQHAATVHLQAWIADRCQIRPTELYGHRAFYPTACPGAIAAAIPQLIADVAAELTLSGRGGPKRRLWPLTPRLRKG
jgi:hypothetical protein